MTTNHESLRSHRVAGWLGGCGLLALSLPLHAQPCEPAWAPALPTCSLHSVDILRGLDDGRGQVPFSAGVGDANRLQVCRRDDAGDGPEGWNRYEIPLPYHINSIRDLALFDIDGSGAASVVVVADSWPTRILQWTGDTWTQIATSPHAIWTAKAFDDGSGPALYVGGNFIEIDGSEVRHMARWRGVGHPWESFGAVQSGEAAASVSALHVHDDGTGEALYIGGFFGSVDGVPARNIARWDGNQWSALGSGLAVENWNRPVAGMASGMEDGRAVLYVGGDFEQAGGQFSPAVVRWNGNEWSQLGDGFGWGKNSALERGVVDGVQHLYVSGVSGGARVWDGSGQWEVLGGGLTGVRNATVQEVAGGDDVLVVGGRWLQGPALSRRLHSLAHWTPATDEWVPEPFGPWGGAILDLTMIELVGERSMVVSGTFHGLSDVDSRHAVAWDGSGWRRFGADLGFRAGVVFDDGGGPALIGAATTCIASGSGWCNTFGRWDPLLEVWEPIGGEIELRATDVAKFDDGEGEAVYVAAQAGGIASLLRWDGTALVPVPGAPESIAHLATINDGAQRGLYAHSGHIWRWDGNDWERIASSTAHPPVMRALDLGAGPALYVTGPVTPVGGSSIPGVARFDGQWQGLGELPMSPANLVVFDDGAGAALHAAGKYLPAVFRFDGNQWQPLPEAPGLGAMALGVWQDSSGSSLWAGGLVSIREADPVGTLARFDACPPCYANCDNTTTEPILTVNDFTCFINAFAEASQLPVEEQISHYANCDGATEPPILTTNDFTCFINAFSAGCP